MEGEKCGFQPLTSGPGPTTYLLWDVAFLNITFSHTPCYQKPEPRVLCELDRSKTMPQVRSVDQEQNLWTTDCNLANDSGRADSEGVMAVVHASHNETGWALPPHGR
jgi:hypothetical protein